MATEFYFNSFSVGMSRSDILISLHRNGEEIVVLNASHVTAKLLAETLNRAIKELELIAEQKVLILKEADDSEEKPSHDDIAT